MRRVMLICYYFPPTGGAGVARPVALARGLKKHGWTCDVLTVKPIAYRVFEPELFEGIDPAQVFRSGSYDPQRLLRLCGVSQISSSTIKTGQTAISSYFPDSKRGWVGPAARMGARMAATNKYDVILSTSPPISCHLVAERIHQKTGLPWIADFRDFWISYKIEDTYRSSSLISRARELKERIISQSVISCCNPAIAKYLGIGHTICNGYNETLARKWQPPSMSDRWRIGLLGSYNELVPLEPLFKVLSKIRECNPEEFNKIELVHVGQIDSNWFQTHLAKYDLTSVAISHGFKSRSHTIELLNNVNLFYFGLNPDNGVDIVPGRLFDMFASGRPVLAAVGETSSSGQLILKTQNGGCFDGCKEDDIAQAADYLIDIIRIHIKRSQTVVPRPNYAREFSSGRMVKQFAELLSETAARN